MKSLPCTEWAHTFVPGECCAIDSDEFEPIWNDRNEIIKKVEWSPSICSSSKCGDTCVCV